MPAWQIVLTATARTQLAAIADTRERAAVARAIDLLATEPDKRGKPLTDELAGLRSIRAAGQRYRVLYRVAAEHVIVYVVMIGRRASGSRRDVYAQAATLLAGWSPPETIQSPPETSDHPEVQGTDKER